MTFKGVDVALWVPSPNYHRFRRTGLKWIVWHSTESPEVRGAAYNVAAGWFAKPASRVSAHIVVDNGADPRYPDGVVECVKPGDTAWHAARGNDGGYGIEIVGRAAQSGADWSDPFSLAAITNACRWINSNQWLAPIPKRWLTDAELRASERGHVVHSQVSRVLGGTHTDPGPGFPYAKVMDLLGAGDQEAEEAAPVDGKRTLRADEPYPKSEDIEALQRGLNAHFPTYSQLTVDGVYGPATAAVIREFQRRVGLTPDGEVGPATYAALAKFGL